MHGCRDSRRQDSDRQCRPAPSLPRLPRTAIPEPAADASLQGSRRFEQRLTQQQLFERIFHGTLVSNNRRISSSALWYRVATVLNGSSSTAAIWANVNPL